MKNLVFIGILLLLIGCENPNKQQLITIASMEHKVATQAQLVKCDELIGAIGKPDEVVKCLDWLNELETRVNIKDANNEVDWIRNKLREVSGKKDIKIDYAKMNVWLYLPNHQYEMELVRFALPSIKTGFYRRPYFVVFDNYVLLSGALYEIKQSNK